jgi:hypothetical protein
MIGMSSVLGVRDDDLRLKSPDHHRDLRARFGGVLDSSVGEAEVLAYRDTHHLRRLGGLRGAQLGSPATRQLSRGEVKDSSGPAKHLRPDQRSAANQLDVIRMRSDGKNVDVFHARKLRALGR